MVATRSKTNSNTVTFWLPDPADLERLMHLLEICGYTDEHLAREDASQDGESNVLFEVTVRKREFAMPQPWQEEINWFEDIYEGVWHA